MQNLITEFPLKLKEFPSLNVPVSLLIALSGNCCANWFSRLFGLSLDNVLLDNVYKKNAYF